jgi:hypothetical protein
MRFQNSNCGRGPELTTKPRPKRPLGVSLLCAAVLIVAVTNMARMVQSLVDWQFLEALLDISPAFLALSGLVWGTLGLLATWCLWQGKTWGRWFSLIYIVIYSVYSWLNRFFPTSYPGRNTNWMFSAGMNLLLIGLSIWILTRNKTKLFFEAIDEP